jgi:hypothetical protein
MRGDDPQQAAIFSYISPEERVPPEHPLRAIRAMVDVVLKELSLRERREVRVTPHVAQSTTGRSSAIDGRTTRHPGYAISQRKRKCVEEVVGWLKTVALLRKVRHRGVARVGWMFTFAAAVYNLVRIRRLAAAA